MVLIAVIVVIVCKMRLDLFYLICGNIIHTALNLLKLKKNIRDKQ